MQLSMLGLPSDALNKCCVIYQELMLQCEETFMTSFLAHNVRKNQLSFSVY